MISKQNNNRKLTNCKPLNINNIIAYSDMKNGKINFSIFCIILLIELFLIISAIITHNPDYLLTALPFIFI